MTRRQIVDRLVLFAIRSGDVGRRQHANGKEQQRAGRLIDSFVKDRAVKPDDVFAVVFDFAFAICNLAAMRREMTVRYGVPGMRFMNMLRRECRRQRQKWRDQQRRDSSLKPRHPCVILHVPVPGGPYGATANPVRMRNASRGGHRFVFTVPIPAAH